MRAVFKSPQLEQQFNKDGFVNVELLSEEEIKELRQIFEELDAEGRKGSVNVDSSYKLSYFNNDPVYKKKVFNTVSAYFQSKLDKILDNYKPLMINIFNKEPGKGEVPVHQNWTFIDEDKYSSVSVWIPLVDVSRENGTMEVVRGSHKVVSKFRGPTIPWAFDALIPVIKEKYMEPINLKAGQASILDDGIIHYTSENNSGEPRWAIQLIMKPEEATPIHYYRPSETEDKLEIIEVNNDFYTTFNMNTKPVGVRSLGFINFKYPTYSEREMVEKISVNNPAILGRVE